MGNETTTIEQLRQNVTPRIDQMPQVRAGFTDLQGFELAQRGAKALAASTLVPQDFRGNVANCLIALEMAQRIGASPLMVMQNLYIVHGRPGWSAKFLIATFNQCGRFSAIRFEWAGTKGKDDWACRAWAIERETGQRIEGAWITWAMVRSEKWDAKNGSKWQTMPEQMFMYRAAAWMVNTHAPEISMGLNTEDELKDTFEAVRGNDGAYVVPDERLGPTVDEPAPQTTPAADAPDAIPMYDAQAAIDLLKMAETLAALDEAWERIMEDFADEGREIPIDVEATFNDRRSALMPAMPPTSPGRRR